MVFDYTYFKCYKCKKLLGKQDSLNRHLKICGKKRIKTKLKAGAFQCYKCHKVLLTQATLNVHVKETCGIKQRIPCNICDKVFNSQLRLNAHVNRTHIADFKSNILDINESDTQTLAKVQEQVRLAGLKVKKTACVCYEEGCLNVSFPALKEYRKHLMEFHGKNITKSTHQFSSLEDFNIWKDSIEKEVGICYGKRRGPRKEGKMEKTIFYCRRSGILRRRGTGKRLLKSQGSCKIGHYCSSTIELCIEDGLYYVTFYEEHSGHTLDLQSLVHIPIPKSDQSFIAGKLAQNVPKDDILQMVRTLNPQGRSSLIKRRDLNNIANTYKNENFPEEDNDSHMLWFENKTSELDKREKIKDLWEEINESLNSLDDNPMDEILELLSKAVNVVRASENSLCASSINIDESD